MGRLVDDISDSTGRWLKHLTVDGQGFTTRSANMWHHVNGRCRTGSAAQRRRPTYVGCSMSENFKDFQWFTEWHRQQVGYGIEGYAIDKDILTPGNREYNENRCVLVPAALNNFLTTRERLRGNYPIGVDCNKKQEGFRARVCIGGVQRFVGYFSTPEEAYQAYVAAKEAEARRWAERLRDGEFVIDNRVIAALEKWRVHD